MYVGYVCGVVCMFYSYLCLCYVVCGVCVCVCGMVYMFYSIVCLCCVYVCVCVYVCAHACMWENVCVLMLLHAVVSAECAKRVSGDIFIRSSVRLCQRQGRLHAHVCQELLRGQRHCWSPGKMSVFLFVTAGSQMIANA